MILNYVWVAKVQPDFFIFGIKGEEKRLKTWKMAKKFLFLGLKKSLRCYEKYPAIRYSIKSLSFTP